MLTQTFWGVKAALFEKARLMRLAAAAVSLEPAGDSRYLMSPT